MTDRTLDTPNDWIADDGGPSDKLVEWCEEWSTGARAGELVEKLKGAISADVLSWVVGELHGQSSRDDGVLLSLSKKPGTFNLHLWLDRHGGGGEIVLSLDLDHAVKMCYDLQSEDWMVADWASYFRALADEIERRASS